MMPNMIIAVKKIGVTGKTVKVVAALVNHKNVPVVV